VCLDVGVGMGVGLSLCVCLDVGVVVNECVGVGGAVWV